MNRHMFGRLSPSKRKMTLLRAVKRAVGKFELLEKGDRVIIAVSGGIDSMSLLDILTIKSAWWARFVEFIPVHVVAGFPHETEDLDSMRDFTADRGFELVVLNRPEIAEIALGDKRPQNPCFTCSRMRRKALFEIADERGANKVALGHHREDVLHTLLINLFWGREIATMMPDQPLFGGRFHLIRPFYLTRQGQINQFAAVHNIPNLSATCPIDGNTRRDYVRNLLETLESQNPGTKSNMFRALFHPKPDYLLGRFAIKD